MKDLYMKQLEDTDPMPFGMYRGKPMSDVPAVYLHWWYTTRMWSSHSPLAEYIKRNMDALKMEYPDGIWETSNEQQH